MAGNARAYQEMKYDLSQLTKKVDQISQALERRGVQISATRQMSKAEEMEFLHNALLATAQDVIAKYYTLQLWLKQNKAQEFYASYLSTVVFSQRPQDLEIWYRLLQHEFFKDFKGILPQSVSSEFRDTEPTQIPRSFGQQLSDRYHSELFGGNVPTTAVPIETTEVESAQGEPIVPVSQPSSSTTTTTTSTIKEQKKKTSLPKKEKKQLKKLEEKEKKSKDSNPKEESKKRKLQKELQEEKEAKASITQKAQSKKTSQTPFKFSRSELDGKLVIQGKELSLEQLLRFSHIPFKEAVRAEEDRITKMLSQTTHGEIESAPAFQTRSGQPVNSPDFEHMDLETLEALPPRDESQEK